jgi:hypothetical protein
MHQYSGENGLPTSWHLVNAGRFAAGGAGLVIVESTKVERRGCGTLAFRFPATIACPQLYCSFWPYRCGIVALVQVNCPIQLTTMNEYRVRITEDACRNPCGSVLLSRCAFDQAMELPPPVSPAIEEIFTTAALRRQPDCGNPYCSPRPP